MVQPQQMHRPPLRSVMEAHVTVTSAAYTAKAGDRVVGVNRAGAVTITLPSTEVRKGRVYTIKDESGAAASNNITVATEGSETIDGSTTDTISENYGSKTYYSDGANWFTIPLLPAASHTLASHTSEAHSELSGVGADDHHAQAHTLDSHSAGTLQHEKGGLEADVNAGDGFVEIKAGATTVIKSNTAATAAPGATDDSAAGYAVGSVWIDTTADKAYVCLDATATAAVWTEITQGGGGTDPVFGRVVRTAGDLTTTSTSLVDVTGATITFTTGVYPVRFSVDQTSAHSVTSAVHGYNVDVDGTLMFGSQGRRGDQPAASANYRQNSSFSGQTAELTAASHTIKEQFTTDQSTLTLLANSTNNHMFSAEEIR